MRHIIRHATFETNSSSSHSITLSSDKVTPELVRSENPSYIGQPLHISGRDFGWEWETYTDWQTKASYALVDGRSREGTEENDNLALLREVLQKYLGVTEVTFDLTEGHIDHQSVGTTENVWKSETSLATYLFSKYSVLQTGNDNE